MKITEDQKDRIDMAIRVLSESRPLINDGMEDLVWRMLFKSTSDLYFQLKRIRRGEFRRLMKENLDENNRTGLRTDDTKA